MHDRKKKCRELFRFMKGSLFCFFRRVSESSVLLFIKMYLEKNKTAPVKTYFLRKYCDIHIVN